MEWRDMFDSTSPNPPLLISFMLYTHACLCTLNMLVTSFYILANISGDKRLQTSVSLFLKWKINRLRKTRARSKGTHCYSPHSCPPNNFSRHRYHTEKTYFDFFIEGGWWNKIYHRHNSSLSAYTYIYEVSDHNHFFYRYSYHTDQG